MRFIISARVYDEVILSEEEVNNIKENIEKDESYIKTDDNTKEDLLYNDIHYYVTEKWNDGNYKRIDYDFDLIERYD